MTTSRCNLVSLIEKLRQEQEFSLFYKTQIRQTIQDINRCCDQVFQSLWLTQCLSHGLEKVRLHHSQCVEWTWALEQVAYVEFIDAAKILRSSVLVDSYNKFLNTLLNDPTVLAQLLVWAESEGLDCTTLISDVMSVIYGHCMFQRDHTLFLGLLKELLEYLVSCAESPRDLFSGVEPIFCRILTEYCTQLEGLQTFLIEAFQQPLADIFLCEEYLEFDVNKAGSRLTSTEGSGRGCLLDESILLFGEDLDSSCEHLAKLAMEFINGIRCLADQFPLSLKWVLGSLKSLIQAKWPHISAVELRRPISSVLFGPMLGSTVVNPDSHGLCDMEVVVSPVARYNLSQVASVLQGCAWVLGRQSGKYPMQKVIKRMNTKSYCDLLDTLDGGYSEEPLELPSALPGLKRSVYLTSQAQLNNLVGLVCEVADAAAKKDDSSPIRDRLVDLKSQLPASVKQLASTSPYSPYSLSPLVSRSPAKPSQSSDPTDPSTLGSKFSTRKRLSTDMVKSPTKSNKKRSNSTSNLHQMSVGGAYVGGSRTATRSISPNQMVSTYSEQGVRSPPGVQNPPGNFQVPSEVLILPISKGSASFTSSSPAMALWDFALLSQEEYMHHRTPSSLKQKAPVAVPSSYPPSLTATISHSASSSTHTLPSLPSKSTAAEPKSHSATAPIPICPSPIPEIPNDGRLNSGQATHNGMEMSSGSAGDVFSPVRERWSAHIRPLRGGGSDSSLSARVSSREPSSSPQSVPKKRSFTISSIENGRFALNNDLSPVLIRAPIANADTSSAIPSSSLPCSPSPVPIITTIVSPTSLSPTSSPHSTSPPITNGISHTNKHPTQTIDSDSKCIPNGAHPTDSRNRAHLNPLQNSDRESTPDPQNASNFELSPSNPDLSASDLASETDLPQSEAPSAVGSSVENLLDESGSISKGSRWKRKLFKRRKKDKNKRKMKSQMSLQEAVKKPDVYMKPRSSSYVVEEFLIVDPEEDKHSSQSHDELEPKYKETSVRTVAQVRRANSIMAKYTALVEEQKKMVAPQIDKIPLEPSLPPFDNVQVKDMDSETFRESLFCKQLEYKLRAALQNVHTPLSSSPLYHQLVADEDSKCDSKYQLTTLLQCALQRSKWLHDVMEIALITETLKMIEQLPNALVGVALGCTHHEQEKRLSYTNYLIQSHMKFQDVRLQVGAMQTSIDRRLVVLKEQFVQFAVQQFLESQSSNLAEFRRQMIALSLADERCSLMTENLEAFTEMLLEDQMWKYWPREDIKMASNYLEDQLFSYVYHHVFQPNMELDGQRDEIFSTHLSILSKRLTPTHRSLQISPMYHSDCPWLSAQKHLKAMALFKSPRGKVHCIAESCRVLISLLQYAKVGSPPGADDLFPVLVYVLIKANPPRLLSTIQYVKNFLEDELSGEENYWWVQFSTAVEFTKTLE